MTGRSLSCMRHCCMASVSSDALIRQMFYLCAVRWHDMRPAQRLRNGMHAGNERVIYSLLTALMATASNPIMFAPSDDLTSVPLPSPPPSPLHSDPQSASRMSVAHCMVKRQHQLFEFATILNNYYESHLSQIQA